jgi:hypothetical protein
LFVDNSKELAPYMGERRTLLRGMPPPRDAPTHNGEFMVVEFLRTYRLNRDSSIVIYYKMYHPAGNDVSYESYVTELFHLRKTHWTRIGPVLPEEGE